MLVMEDRRKDVKDILNEELDKLRQRIIENHIPVSYTHLRAHET